MNDIEIIEFLKSLPSPFRFEDVNRRLVRDGKPEILMAMWNRLVRADIIRPVRTTERRRATVPDYKLR